MTPYVTFQGVGKTYDTEGVKVNALHDVSFEIGEGEVCVIVGQSGAGKTTLLNILGGMDTLTAGKVFLGGEEVSAYNRRQLTRYRREDVGFVFQFYNLIPNLTALENVEMATELAKAPFSAKQVLEDVGLGERMHNFPAQLSGGEQQRVAIARALAPSPKVLIADEPTGNLDTETGRQIADLLFAKQAERGMTLLLVTHDPSLAARCSRRIGVRSGQIESDSSTLVSEPA